MPKIVDHDQRRSEIADATIRVIARDGIQRTSVRAVLAETGMSSGALRHYFPSHTDLLRFASIHLNARSEGRVRTARLAGHRSPADQVIAMCEALLPLGEPRREDIRAYAQLAALDGADAQYRADAAPGVGRLARICVELLDPSGRLPEDRRRILADRLHWALDGIAAQEVLFPGHMNAATMRSALREVIEDLVREVEAAPAP
ncbi:TetR/AcrR family transcriptional regulator [Helcobacillus sp. ACRRO]|uniref:TetR/AcrR family transcriptional regulator n=1 Tax=Helcobacillus sp. ACRRO TaxID=2918202 RepID=UPI001EF4F180|nr:TetR/AcrR family transcriptional regulator [Helcobacillus sp. ACRRO]MCG7427818.1 TetR/AcrR family transcriptional regulator [Helcobacillus sp. ACRRO]